MKIVDVLFPLALPFHPSYRVVGDDENNLKVGSFVRAPIGNRTYLGVVTKVYSDNSQNLNKPIHTAGSLKFITSLETQLLPVDPKRIELWRWISEYYLCTMGEVMKTAIISKPIHSAIQGTDNSVPERTKKMEMKGVTLIKGGYARMNAYLTLCQEALSSGYHVLFLTPEIGYVDQLFHILKGALQQPVFLLHSNLTPVQKANTIQSIWEQKGPLVVIGMRTSLLLVDLQNFGLIIVDEEHDYSYKQIDPAPRFHARDVALFIGKLYQIDVVLGSSCPSLESQYNVAIGKYKAFNLEQPKHSIQLLPTIEVIDTLRLQKKRCMIDSLSTPFLKALEHCLVQQQQTLLFTHRCAQIEAELHAIMPHLRIARLDEAHSLFALQLILARFHNREIDVLISIQSLYKNIISNNLGIVAFFDPDKQLSRSDFRAHERTFQIVSTIHDYFSPPRIILQTKQPELPFYKYLQSYNYKAFIENQLRERKEFHYPPFVRLIAIRCKHSHLEIAQEAAQQCKEELLSLGISNITGPFSPYQPHPAKFQLQLLWIHLPRNQDIAPIKKTMYQKVSSLKLPKGRIQIDVDPY